MKWKVQIQVISEVGKWHGNGKEFDSKPEAESYAKDLFNRWTQTTSWRVIRLK